MYRQEKLFWNRQLDWQLDCQPNRQETERFGRQNYLSQRRRQKRGQIFLLVFAVPVLLIVLVAYYVLWGTPTKGSAMTQGVSNSRSAQQSTGAISNADDWQLLLVNPWNALPDGYSVTLVQLKNGQSIDERCYLDLQNMMDDCRAEGLHPLICSSYRLPEKQQQLFDTKVNSLLTQGYSYNQALELAASEVATPGTSEHQTGLAVDIVDEGYQLLDASQEGTATQQWLFANSWKYGFVLRYPSDKVALTGILYEPWHYRYVGKEAASEMFERGLCLEEYLGSTE